MSPLSLAGGVEGGKVSFWSTCSPSCLCARTGRMKEEKHLLLLMLQVSWSTPFWMGGPLHCGSPDGGQALARPLSDLLLALPLKVPPEPLPAGVPLPSRHSSCLGHQQVASSRTIVSLQVSFPCSGSPGLDPILTRCLSGVPSGEWVPGSCC